MTIAKKILASMTRNYTFVFNINPRQLQLEISKNIIKTRMNALCKPLL